MAKKLIEKLIEMESVEKKSLNLKISLKAHQMLDEIANKTDKSKRYIASMLLEEEIPKLYKYLVDMEKKIENTNMLKELNKEDKKEIEKEDKKDGGFSPQNW